MKELASAVSQAMANRLKVPIIGSFILAWLVINGTDMMLFLYSDVDTKLLLLKQETVWFVKSWSAPFLMKIVYPSFAALVYTFGLPLLQHSIDGKKHSLIDEKRIEAQHERQRITYVSQGRAAEAQAKSSLEYHRDLLSRDLDDWEGQRTALKDDLAAVRIDRDSANSQLKSYEASNEKLAEEIEVHKNQCTVLRKAQTELEEKIQTLESRDENHVLLQKYVGTAAGIEKLIGDLNSSEFKKFDSSYLDKVRNHDPKKAINELRKKFPKEGTVKNYALTGIDNETQILDDYLDLEGSVYAVDKEQQAHIDEMIDETHS